ncbi:SDR family oxidoreductase [Alphaproteobacteria bacterium]|nr:SDR family oxidoreductase [Alphaproteobacteria bacterium]
MVNNTKSLFSLANKTALLTGASGFLGRGMAESLLDAGTRLVALGRSDHLLEQAEQWRIRFGNQKVRTELIDMYDLPATETLLRQIAYEEEIGILVNNAHELNATTGFNDDSGQLETAEFDGWMRNLTAGAYWPALTTRVLGVGMKSRGDGSIINISSMYAVVAPNPRLYEGTKFVNPPGYSASKAAMLALTRYTAAFWGPFGIRANAIVAGPFSNTDESGPNAVSPEDPFLQRLYSRTCLGRTGRPEDLTGPLLFLASSASNFVTGHALAVDGGWTIT